MTDRNLAKGITWLHQALVLPAQSEIPQHRASSEQHPDECFKCGLKECECDALDKSQIARDEQGRKETLRAERDTQLENDPEYGPWLDSL